MLINMMSKVTTMCSCCRYLILCLIFLDSTMMIYSAATGNGLWRTKVDEQDSRRFQDVLAIQNSGTLGETDGSRYKRSEDNWKRLGATEVATKEAIGGIKRRVVRVVGGIQSAPNNRWPWLAELLLTNRKSRHICGGTLISEHHVLTAAHCFDRYNTSEITIRLGEYDRSFEEGSERDYKIISIEIHSRYDRHKKVGSSGAGYQRYRSLDHDIALLTIASTMETNEVGLSDSIHPIQLPDKDEFKEGHQGCYVIGWGYTHYSNLLSDLLMPSELRPGFPSIVHEANIELLSNKVCKKHYYNRFTSRMLCAGLTGGGRDTCDGDSGGPLACQNMKGEWKLWGITSWGDNNLCNPESDKPGVYVRVARYLKWIAKTKRRLRERSEKRNDFY